MKVWKGFQKGVNLGGWMSQCDYSKERLVNFIQREDIERIASWGVDHVRLPIDFNILENADGSYKENGFFYINNAIHMCFDNDLNVVLDLHKTAGFSFDFGEQEAGFFDNPALQERFYRLWEQLAERYGKYPDRIAFELLNEVTEETFIDAWNRISHECIRRIRAFAPDTVILVGSYYNNSATTVSALAAPYDDKIVFNFHCYEPLKFTHQGATWTPAINPDERISFEESNITTEYFEELFASAIEAAQKNNTLLYCGEYGVIDRVSPEDTLKWYQTIHAVLDKYHIGRSAWSYKEMDFGLSDNRLNGIIRELIKVL
ncbi:MAG: cellulase family glycosylhydrolase [Lachnospiraceae bacterium]|nr:cellulase family glycosylhydrolase [Lachnospiraceae bacterium]